MTPEKITSWEAADQALANLARLRRELVGYVTWREDLIAMEKQKYLARAQPLEAERAALAAELHRFVLTHEDELEGRSKKLTHGRVGLLLVWDLKVRSIKKAVAGLLIAKKWTYLRVKYELNKETLWEAPPEILKACGAKRRSRDEFWYEVDGQRWPAQE